MKLVKIAILLLSFVLSLQLMAQTDNNPGAQEQLDDKLVVSDYLSEITNVVCPFKSDIDYETERVSCGFISVPENREKQNSRIIRLAFTKINAEARLDKEDDEKEQDEEELVLREDPIIYLTGGPGAGIEFYVKRFIDHDITKTRDFYILNQRGIGDSEELCRYYNGTSRENVLAKNLEEQQVEDAERMKACFKAASARGVDLSAYNTVENARDVKALRQALGFDNWNVWGISYGSHLGQMLVNIDPEGIRALVLDAIVPNDLGDLMRFHRWVARNHKNVFDECERQGASVCDGLEEAFYAAANDLTENPMTVDAIDKELFPSGKATVPSLIVAFAPFSMLYEQESYPAIPAVMQGLINMVDERDEEVFKLLASDDDMFSGFSQGMGSAIRCNDGYMAAEAESAAEDLQEPFGFNYGAFTVEGSKVMAQACVDAGLAPRDRKDYQLVKSDIPTLIVNGDWDPITPPPLAERIAPGFSNGRLIIVPYAGHGPTRSMPECAAQVMNDFFDDPSQNLSELDAKCLEEGPEPPVFLDFVETHMPLKLASRAMEDPKNVVGSVVLVSSPIFISLLGFLMIAYGAIARRFSSSTSPIQGIGPLSLRLSAMLTTLLVLFGAGLIGIGIANSIEFSEVSILAGFAPPAGIGALVILLAGVLGIATIFKTFNVHKEDRLRKRSLFGFVLIGIAAILLSIVSIMWDVTPW